MIELPRGFHEYFRTMLIGKSSDIRHGVILFIKITVELWIIEFAQPEQES